VEGFGLTVQYLLESKVMVFSGAEFSGSSISGFGSKVSGFRSQVLGFGSPVSNFSVFGCRV
jgi:hypothetical protein